MANNERDQFSYDWSHTFKDTVIGPDGVEVSALIIFPAAVCYLVPGMGDLLFFILWVVGDISIRKRGYTAQSFINRIKVKITVSKLMGGTNRIKVRRWLKAKKLHKALMASAE